MEPGNVPLWQSTAWRPRANGHFMLVQLSAALAVFLVKLISVSLRFSVKNSQWFFKKYFPAWGLWEGPHWYGSPWGSVGVAPWAGSAGCSRPQLRHPPLW